MENKSKKTAILKPMNSDIHKFQLPLDRLNNNGSSNPININKNNTNIKNNNTNTNNTSMNTNTISYSSKYENFMKIKSKNNSKCNTMKGKEEIKKYKSWDFSENNDKFIPLASPILRSPRHNLRKNFRKTTTESSLDEHKKQYLIHMSLKNSNSNVSLTNDNKKNDSISNDDDIIPIINDPSSPTKKNDVNNNNNKPELFRSFSDPMILASWDMFDLEDYGIDNVVDSIIINDRMKQFEDKNDCITIIKKWSESIIKMPQNFGSFFEKKTLKLITKNKRIEEMREKKIELTELVNSRTIITRRDKKKGHPNRDSINNEIHETTHKKNSLLDWSSENTSTEEDFNFLLHLFTSLESKNEIVLGTDMSRGRLGIKCGTLPQIIEKLVEFISQEEDKYFLDQIRSLCLNIQRFNISVDTVLDELQKLYKNSKFCDGVFRFVREWLKIETTENKGNNKKLIKTLRDLNFFNSNHILQIKIFYKFKENTEEEGEKNEKKKIKGTGWFQKTLPKEPKDIDFIDLEIVEVATILSVIDAEMMELITSDEFVHKYWVKKNWAHLQMENSSYQPAIWTCIKRWVKVSNWVSTEIIFQPKLTKRASVIKRFILIAKKLWDMNNFHTAIAIISALNSGPVTRLKLTWKGVSKKYIDIFEEIEKRSTPLRHYKFYRREIESCLQKKLPFIPFLGVITKDNTDIEYSFEDYEKNGFINFQKMFLFYRSNMSFFESQIHLFKEYIIDSRSLKIKQYLSNLYSTKDENQLMQESLRLEINY
eukprot:TRINITY_DN15148_c0_g1_i1.p1 TRINITY_DN15148_c0_g1~~TRINITY_DN15148_c0_g1_i1.p1  ORF type:complete len:766 (+),score=235.17 TRINITY_DN15148_c0_g1_i1:56-2353(+)